MRILKYLLIAMLLIVGCGEEPKENSRHNGKRIQSASGREEKLSADELEKRLIDVGIKSLTDTWDIAPYNFKVDLTLRYDDGLVWKAVIKDAEGKLLHETKYVKRLKSAIRSSQYGPPLLELGLGKSSSPVPYVKIKVDKVTPGTHWSNTRTQEGKLAEIIVEGKESDLSKETCLFVLESLDRLTLIGGFLRGIG